MTIGLALAGANVPMLLALNLGISFTSVALTPAEGSMIPRVVPRAQLQTAMGIFNLTLQGVVRAGVRVPGPAARDVRGAIGRAGRGDVPCTSPRPSPASGCRARRRTRGTRESGREAVLRPIHELREGLRVIRRDREVSRPILHQAAGASVAGVLGVLGPGLAATIGLEPIQLAVIVVPLGIGVVIGVVRRCAGSATACRIGGPRRAGTSCSGC